MTDKNRNKLTKIMRQSRESTLDNGTLLIRCPERWIRSRSDFKTKKWLHEHKLKSGITLLGFLQSIYDSSVNVRIYKNLKKHKVTSY